MVKRLIRVKLNEDKRLERYKVWFTPAVKCEIDIIKSFNKNNIEGIKQLQEYLQGLRMYISNPVLAWDNLDRFQHYPNGATHINELGYNFIYYVKNSKFEHTQYVCVVKIYYNLSEFGLQDPFATIGNQQGQKVKESILNRKTNRLKRTIYLKESELRLIIDESVKRVLDERRNRILTEAVGRSFRRVLREHLTRNS